MNKFLLIFLLPFASLSQTDAEKEIHQTINQTLAIISGDKGEARDWATFRTLFTEKAQFHILQRNPKDTTKTIKIISIDVETFVANAGPNYEKNGFLETETDYVIHLFNKVAHVEQKYTAEQNGKQFEGVNYYQLVFDGEKWRITSLTWDEPDAEHPLPEKL